MAGYAWFVCCFWRGRQRLTDVISPVPLEQLSRTVHSDYADAPIPGDVLANQSVRLKEEQLRREEDKLREIELKVQREIQEKRQELLAKEESLRSLETRLAAAQE